MGISPNRLQAVSAVGGITLERCALETSVGVASVVSRALPFSCVGSSVQCLVELPLVAASGYSVASSTSEKESSNDAC